MSKVKALQADLEQGLLSAAKVMYQSEAWNNGEDVELLITNMLKACAANIAQSVSLDTLSTHNEAVEASARVARFHLGETAANHILGLLKKE